LKDVFPCISIFQNANLCVYIGSMLLGALLWCATLIQLKTPVHIAVLEP